MLLIRRCVTAFKWLSNFNKWIRLGLIIVACSVASYAQNPVSFSVNVDSHALFPGGSAIARLSATIDPGWKIYAINQTGDGPVATQISLPGGPFKAVKVQGPKYHSAIDENFGIITKSYSGSVTFNILFDVDPSISPGPQTFQVNVLYQACNDTVCLPPKTIKASAALDVLERSIAPAASRKVEAPSASPSVVDEASPAKSAPHILLKTGSVYPLTPSDAESEATLNFEPAGQFQSQAANLSEGTTPLRSFIWLSIIFGALSLLTPCVFPMVPITVSFFSQKAEESARKAFRNSLIFVGGIILTFTGFGVAVALIFGAAGMNRFASSPITNLLLTVTFLAFAGSLFGRFDLGLPSQLLTKLDSIGRKRKSGSIAGILVMGAAFSLTTFACTSPMVGTILVSAAKGELVRPIVGMFVFSTTFALPFFVLAMAPKWIARLPKSGRWMTSLKITMGFIEIGAAVKFLSNVDVVLRWGVFTREVVIASWIALVLLIVLYLLDVFRFANETRLPHLSLTRMALAFIFATLGLFLTTGLTGAGLGEVESFLPPRELPESRVSKNGSVAIGGDWIINDYQQALRVATKEKKRIFIDFTGYTCTNCRWMEANMFTNPVVKAQLDKYVLVRLYTDGLGELFERHQQLELERFGTVALPLYAIVDSQEAIIASSPGLTRDVQTFLAFLGTE